MISQLFPGSDPDTSVTHQNFLATFEPNSEQKEEIARTMEFLRYVVAEEDYSQGIGSKRQLKLEQNPTSTSDAMKKEVNDSTAGLTPF